jgi:hypothetical protein
MKKVKKVYITNLVKVTSEYSNSIYCRTLEIEGYPKLFIQNNYSKNTTSVDINESIYECGTFDKVDEYKAIIEPVIEQIIDFLNSKANGIGRKTKTFKSKRLVK